MRLVIIVCDFRHHYHLDKPCFGLGRLCLHGLQGVLSFRGYYAKSPPDIATVSMEVLGGGVSIFL